MIVNFLNNAVSSYGIGPVVGTSVIIGILTFPAVKLIGEIALDIFKACYKWVQNTTLLIRIRSMGCDQCAEHHRVHIHTMNIIHNIHEREAAVT